MKMRPITIELVEEDADALAEFAKEAGRSLEEFARDAVLDRLEDAQDLRDGMAALEAFKDSGERAIPLEEIMREHGVAD